jgi:membrane protein required for colicin V production
LPDASLRNTNLISGTFAAPASPAAARRPHRAQRGTLAPCYDPRRSLGSIWAEGPLTALDILLVVFLALFAFRGWVRGFCRESFGLLGLIGGVLVAAAAGPVLTEDLIARELIRPRAALPAAWAMIFLAVLLAASVLGRLADRIARALFLGGVNRVAGIALGCAKGAVFLGFGLLAAERLAPSRAETIEASRLGRPLSSLARQVLQAGRPLVPPSAAQSV